VGFVLVKVVVRQIHLAVLSPCPAISAAVLHVHGQPSAKRCIGVSLSYHTDDIVWLLNNLEDSGGQ